MIDKIFLIVSISEDSIRVQVGTLVSRTPPGHLLVLPPPLLHIVSRIISDHLPIKVRYGQSGPGGPGGVWSLDTKFLALGRTGIITGKPSWDPHHYSVPIYHLDMEIVKHCSSLRVSGPGELNYVL